MAVAQEKPFLNVGDVLPSVWPSFLPTLPQGALDKVWVQPLELDQTADEVTTRTKLLFETDLAFGIPGLDAVKLVLAGYQGATVVPVEVQVTPDFALRVREVPLALRFGKELLKPVRKAASGGGGAVAWEADPTREHVELGLGTASLEVNGDGDISLAAGLQLDLPPAMIGDTGIVVEARDIDIYLDAAAPPPPGQPAGWRGVHIAQASLYLPGELGELVGQLQLTDAYIGNGGFTGTVSSTWSPPLSATLFGVGFTLQSVHISFVQNALVASSIAGTVTLPFFDEPLGVEIAVNLNGAFTVRLVGPGGLAEFAKPGILSLKVQSLGFSVADSLFTATMSGTLTPLFGGLDWPGFEVRELSIDSQGHVHIDGGWLALREQYALNFYGFTFEITKVGLGTNDDGSRWVGFSGGLKLVEGIKAGVSVEGLRVTWRPGGGVSVSFEGIGVKFEIPGTLRFEGAVAYRELTVGAETVRRFDGALKLELLALDLTIDANLVVGNARGPDGNYSFMAIYVGVELPAGIPLFSTGLAMFGMAGLFAMNMEPGRLPDEPWYGIGPGEGWYKRAPEIGVTNLTKWVNRKGSVAFGAGLTIGTLSDNGYTFNGSVLLVMVLPGPVLMIEGKANILKERASLGDDPMFRCLAVLDFRAGHLLVGLDARYKVDESGGLIDISAGSELFFNFSDPSAWHMYLGMRDPLARRIRARILRIFDANSYFMLDARSLAIGAWVGYAADWNFGPLRVVLEAWIEGNAKVNWKPLHFYGDLWAHGRAELSVFGFGLELTVDARIEADAFDPFHLLGEFSVGINLPWPLPDFNVNVTLEWGPEPDWPAAPLPLQEVAVEHLKASTSWPLSRADNLLLPDYGDGEGFRLDWSSAPSFNPAAPPPAGAPVVPVDCRPRLTFSRAVHDVALVGTSVSLVDPAEERIGDPERNQGPVRARYELLEVALQTWNPAASNWATAARKAAPSLPPNPAGVESLFGSWAPTPPMPDGGGPNKGQTKLMVWSKNPYDYTRRGGREWQEWTGGHYGDDPCVQIPEQTEQCWTFDELPLGPVTTVATGNPEVRLWSFPGNPELQFTWLGPEAPFISFIVNKRQERIKAICLPREMDKRGPFGASNFVFVRLPPGANRGARVMCRDFEGVQGVALDASGAWHGPVTGGLHADPVVEFATDDVTHILLMWKTRMCFWGVCVLGGASQVEIDEAQTVAQHNISEVERWKEIGTVLRPHTAYRLLVRTKIVATPSVAALGGQRVTEQVEYAFFRTEGPPTLANLWIPAGAPRPEEAALRNAQGQFIRIDGTVSPTPAALKSELNDLTLYVRQTLPPTVPAAGEDRPLPRPVYRGYDLGVNFNEDYVSQMYRMDGRDLAVYLYDSNNLPVRTPDGRLVVVGGRWDVSATPTLDEQEKTWITAIQHSSCAGIDESDIPRDETLTASGMTLAPDYVYEARVTPLLLHESFPAEPYPIGATASGTGATLGGWVAEDLGAELSPSLWQIAEVGIPAVRVVRQTSNIHSLPLDARAPAKHGTTLLLADRADLSAGHPDQPANWTDYRLTLLARSAGDGAFGVTFRRMGAQRWYRFSMDRARRYRRLVRAVDGVVTVLAEDDFVYRSDQDYEITVEAVGPDLAVYQDGALVFRVNDPSLDHGTLGLYSWLNPGTQFADVRVDDFRQTARPAYRFAFTTSLFANFAHQLHSYDDETWRATVTAAAVSAAAANAVAPATAPTGDEARAWVEVETSADWSPFLRTAPRGTEVTRVDEVGGSVLGFLVRSPEPFDWSRCGLAVLRATAVLPPARLPGKLKLTGVTRHESAPNAESVSLIVREAMSPRGYVIEQRALPGPLAPPAAVSCLLEEDFNATGGTLFEETYGPNALDLYEIVDAGSFSKPSAWSVVGNSIRQTSNIYGGPFNKAALSKPGTTAVTGSPDWGDVRVRLDVTSGDDDSVGLLFRYVDAGNFYRFEMNREFGYRRLVKASGGVFTELWSEDRDYLTARRYQIEVVASGAHLYGFLDTTLVFHVVDAEHRRGRAGLYCWANVDTTFEAFRVEAAPGDPLLWHPALLDLAAFTPSDAPGAAGGPSAWQSDGAGEVYQTSNIHVPDAADPAKFGTFLLGGDDWRDVRIGVRLQSGSGGALGLMFRVIDGLNYYRFSMDRQNAYRRLVKVVGGAVTVLWQDSFAYALNQPYDLTVRAVGPEIEVWLAGQLIAATSDASITSGRLALYACADADARFSGLSVFDAARRVGQWEIVDQGTLNAPSDWRLSRGQLVQRSNIWGGSASPTSPDKRGTMAVAGVETWRDYRLAVECSTDDNDAIGVVFRFRDPANYYLFALDAERSYRRLVKVVNDVPTVLWQTAQGYTVGDPLRLTVDAVGDLLTGYFGDTRLFSVTDGAHAQGRVGLYCWENDGARFERVEVCTPPGEARALFADDFSTAGLAGWNVIDAGGEGGPSAWAIDSQSLAQSGNIHSLPLAGFHYNKEGTYAVAGDPAWGDVVLEVDLTSNDADAIGLMFRYADDDNYYRFSMDRQRAFRRLLSKEGGVFRLLWEDSVRYTTGRRYRLTVIAEGDVLRGFIDGLPVFVVRDATHARGRLALYCWSNQGARFNRVRVYPAALAHTGFAIDENFPLLRTFRWSFLDEGDTGGPSDWSVADGRLAQTTPVSDSDPARALGTLAVAGDPGWRDYRFSAVLRASLPGDVGVVFRRADATHYYRFSIDSRSGERSLVRRDGNNFATLWSGVGRIALNRKYIITVECVGTMLTVSINGVRILALDDDGPSAGGVGLYCHDAAGNEFYEVRVCEPQWSAYYRFGREEVLEAGTRLRVHSGSYEPPPPGSLEARRFVTSAIDREDVRFKDEMVDLRLVGPDAAEHARRFLRETDYLPVGVKVLRKADGTAFLLLPDAGGTFPRGQYRLRFEYRRDDTAGHHFSPVLSERGSKLPEQDQIDVPWQAHT